MVVVLRSANRRGCKLEYDQPFQKKKKKKWFQTKLKNKIIGMETLAAPKCWEKLFRCLKTLFFVVCSVCVSVGSLSPFILPNNTWATS